MQEKIHFKEQSFKLFEIATFIYDNAYTKDHLDIITRLVNKVKGNFNVSKG